MNCACEVRSTWTEVDHLVLLDVHVPSLCTRSRTPLRLVTVRSNCSSGTRRFQCPPSFSGKPAEPRRLPCPSVRRLLLPQRLGRNLFG